MDIDQALAVSASGLDAQKTRLNTIASNLANVSSTRTAEGGPYRRRDVVFKSVPVQETFQAAMDSSLENNQGVEVSDTVLDQRPFKRVYEPQHPDADPDGFVSYPNVNPAEEMVNMLSALRSYEANVTAMNATKSMAMKALEIGR
ncbi:MAG TPA: flagellar basal body rod protein FlgC [Nitrospiria bacterium]|nr:flagellar basal body rod protein FlgC [Nitrospiria bacterium]